MPDIPTSGDSAERLQGLVAGWRGAERGQPVTALHEECRQAAGAQAAALLPARLATVAELDVSTLRRALHQRGIGAEPAFRVPPVGRFDAALAPIGPADAAPDRWLLALDSGLSLQQQVALYGHALGHLLLAHADRQMGAIPDLDPAEGRTHVDSLATLRRVEQGRSLVDRRVLEAYPVLAALLQPEEAAGGAAADGPADLYQQLVHRGWRGSLVNAPYAFTAGRVLGRSGDSVRRGRRDRIDALLRAEASLPIGVVQVLRPGEMRGEAAEALRVCACDRLQVPFAYLLEGDLVHEYDWTAAGKGRHAQLQALPARDELLSRWLVSLGLDDASARETLCYPYDLRNGAPRYYQDAAINRAIVAVLQARRGLRAPRILLTQATGTGKTKVAFQIAWKLRQTRAAGNVLFLTDRDTLLSQAMDNDFAPFGEARARVRGALVTSKHLIFATYQALAGDALYTPLYRRYARDFFSVVIVDECHRGSAQDDSNWRSILEWFTGAVQLGLTATPLRTDNVQTYDYFGTPVVTYSLRQGIVDGFLAPYKVRRVLMDGVPHTGDPARPAAQEQDVQPHLVGDATATMLREEARSVLLDRTEAIAQHLAGYLRNGDPMAKTIVFCLDQAHAERMREALARACPEQVARYPDYVERIVADEGQDGKRALGRFKQPGKVTPVIVTTSRLLSTGVDVPTCKNIVLARPVESIVEFKQIIGRGTRLFVPDKTAFTIIDYAGATKYFFDPEFDGDPETVTIDTLAPTQAAGDPQPSPEHPDGDTTADLQSGPVAQPVTGAAPVPDGGRVPPSGVTSNGNGASPAAAPTGGYQPQPDLPRTPMSETPQPLAPSASSGAAVAGPTAAEGAPSEPDPIGTAPVHPGAAPPSAPNRAQATRATSTTRRSSAGGPGSERVRQGDGQRVRVIGEIVLELAPDGTTLRAVSYRDYAREALAGLCATPAELRARWLRPGQQAEIRERLEEHGVKLWELAEALRLPEADPFDLLLHVAFGRQALTRRERANRLQREHAEWLSRYEGRAREILETVLAKYVEGQAPDVGDVRLLQVSPLSQMGTALELAQAFPPPGVREALHELRELLYTA